MKRKTIKSLLSKKRVVYLRLSTQEIADAFFALAKYEGFKLSDELKQKEKLSHLTFVKLNDDMTISTPNYRSWAGAIRFYAAKTENGKKVVKIDFEKML